MYAFSAPRAQLDPRVLGQYALRAWVFVRSNLHLWFVRRLLLHNMSEESHAVHNLAGV